MSPYAHHKKERLGILYLRVILFLQTIQTQMLDRFPDFIVEPGRISVVIPERFFETITNLVFPPTYINILMV
ncbi:hypothetical protein DFR64_1274 [Pelolinea submarina]|uniref:Uncharacterized protein n=1 Tax=Pelolinea submarina TaxID=913107 RepID=A0A3E0AI79_9CHLR|nr:hypothetical protein DFR64_1274 [Pelolinea submarina]